VYACILFFELVICIDDSERVSERERERERKREREREEEKENWAILDMGWL